jgi:hypothetical protein
MRGSPGELLAVSTGSPQGLGLRLVEVIIDCPNGDPPPDGPRERPFPLTGLGCKSI